MRYSVTLTETINEGLYNHLIRHDGQEDLCFAFYKLSSGGKRKSAIINEVLFPKEGDRNVHGNVSFNPSYFDKATAFALKNNYGICFIHSHPSSGWQGMSNDDIKAEEMLASRVKAITRLPLVGLTIGTDNYWSARFWIKENKSFYKKYWCESVRVIGKKIKPYYYDKLSPPREFGQEFQRTISSWGDSKQNDISRLTVGIVGLGSVGSIIAESLMRTGIGNIKLIDFDLVELKNLDRLLAVNKSEIGKYKVDVVKQRLLKTNLLSHMNIEAIPYSIIEYNGIKAALDCDILFSCVDMPMPRYILDCLSFANLIPVIDGGIDTNPNKSLSNIDQARWKAHTVGAERICMKCLGQYLPEDVALEISGELDDPSYIKGLPKEHFINRGENVFGFSLSLAGMEIQQFLSLILNPRGIYYGPKEMGFNTGNIDFDFENDCNPDCDVKALLSSGDETNITLPLEHKKAEESRALHQELNNTQNMFFKRLKHFFKFIF